MNDDIPVQTSSSGLTDPVAFTLFMRNYQDMVFTTAVRLTGDAPTAEDIAQEVFMKAHAHFGMLQASPAAGGWLKTVTTNLALNHLTRYRNRWRLFSELRRADSDGGDSPPEAEFAAPEELFSGLDAAERRECVGRALAQLPTAQRVPLVLYHFEELSCDEIAGQLGVSLAKVKTDIYRARAALAKLLRRGGPGRETFPG